MLSLFLLINSLSLTNYQQYTEVPYVNDPIYNLTFDNFTNITSCSNYCDDFYNCSGFVLRDNTTCLGVHNDTVTTFENNSVYYKKRYCNTNCNSLNFFINTEGNRCFCDEQCDDIEFDDCCNDYHSFCVTSSPTTSGTSTCLPSTA